MRITLSQEWRNDLSAIPDDSVFIGLTSQCNGFPQIFVKSEEFAGGYAIIVRKGKYFEVNAIEDGETIEAWAPIPRYRVDKDNEHSS